MNRSESFARRRRIRLYRPTTENSRLTIVQTLVAYCMNMFHTAQTANELFIHKNSLLYRLGRVGTLFGLDLNDFHDVFEFYRGYKLSVYLEHLEKERGEALD